MNRPGRTPRRKLSLLLATLLLLGSAPAAATAQGGGSAAQRFTSGELSFEHPAGWEVLRETAAQAQTFILKRAGVNAEIRLIITLRTVAGAGVAPETLLTAARQSLIAPAMEQLIAAAALSGQTPARAPSRADFGGAPVEGERLSLTLNNSPAAAEFYALLVGGRLAVVIFIRSDEAAPQAAPAWDIFRRALRSGPPPSTASNEAGAGAVAAAATPAPAPPAATAPPISMSALGEAEKLMNRFFELTKEVLQLRGEGNYAAAQALAERALALAEAGAGPGLPPDFFNPLVATAANNLAELHKLRGDYKRAEPLYLRALAIRERTEGPSGDGLAVPLSNLAAFYLERGDHARAEPLFQRALSIFEKTYGPDHPQVATALNNLAQLYDAKNDYPRAEQLLRRSLAVTERALGPDHPDLAVTLNNLAALEEVRGDHERAEGLYRRALSIREKSSGPDHPDYATQLSNLALLYKRQGDFLRAEPLYQQALAISERALGPDHPLVASVLDNTAQLFSERGDTRRAESLLRRAHLIRERAYGPDHPDVAQSLNNLALLLQGRGEYAEAERLFARALTAFEKTYGPEHGLVATALDNLAGLYSARREFARAEPLFARALAAREKIFGPASAEVAVSLNNAGSLDFARGNYRRAESFYQRSLAVNEQSLGPRHPTVAISFSNLSTAYLALGDTARAVGAQRRVNDIREHHLALMLTTGSEGQKHLYMRTLAEETDYSVFLHAVAAPADAQALRLALSAVLQRKGRVLDAMSDQLGTLRRRLRPADRALFDQLATARARLAALVLGGPGVRTAEQYQAEIATLGAEVERLETSVGARRSEVRAQTVAVTLEAVQRALPEGAALVEIAVFKPYHVKSQTRAERWGRPRYAAYVMRHAGAPGWVDLGDADSLNQSVADLRAALADPRRADVRALARALDERVMRPLRALLGEARHVFLSPDGALNLVPFAALVDEQNCYLVENYTITYLTSGRDLLRLQSADAPPQQQQQQGAVVLANPAFDGGAAAAAGRTPDTRGRRSADLASARFARLPGTAAEAQAIGAILPGARLLTDAQATEAALKEVARPGILHIATHGFFLTDQSAATNDGAARGLTLGGAATAPAGGGVETRGENPLLRSGLALAGANARRDGAGEDGILTALEAAGLDLWGTKLVVLSACETGVGEVHSGEGVYGLRRALVLAGSESQVMSLWQVSDEATRDLMVDYYRRLQAGEGRSEALRRVQLAMLAGGGGDGGSGGGGAQGPGGAAAQRGLMTPGAGGKSAPGARDRSHPFYWAAFIQSGEWKRMPVAAR